MDSRIDVIERQIKSLRRDYQAQQEWLDTICSPLHKRIWWWFGGYKFYTVSEYVHFRVSRVTGDGSDNMAVGAVEYIKLINYTRS